MSIKMVTPTVCNLKYLTNPLLDREMIKSIFRGSLTPGFGQNYYYSERFNELMTERLDYLEREIKDLSLGYIGTSSVPMDDIYEFRQYLVRVILTESKRFEERHSSEMKK